MGRNRRVGLVVRETLERFPHLSALSVSKYLVLEYGELFDNSIDKARDLVRYHRGKKTGGGGSFCPNPVKSDIKMPPTRRVQRIPHKLSSGLWLVINDLHVPFHEIKPIESAIKCAQAEKIDGIFINGDFQDCHAATFWLATSKRDFDDEIEKTIDMLDFLTKELNPKQIVYKPGNHEDRLPRQFASKMPDIGFSMGGIIAQTEILGFEQRGIEYLDSRQLVMAGKLPVLHGHEVPMLSRAVNPARGLFLRTKTWSMCAHCHTTSEHTSKNVLGTLLTTWSVGCLCSLSPDYNPYGNDWCWGFALVNVEKNDDFEVINRRILPSGDVV